MFSQTWKKYLPVIIILIKRSAAGEQTLSLNHSDFERAAGGRKIKYNFTQLQLNNGRINTEVKHSPVAKELSVILQEDDNVSKYLKGRNLEFSLNSSFTLTIKNNTPVEETEVIASSENTLEETTKDISEEETAGVTE